MNKRFSVREKTIADNLSEFVSASTPDAIPREIQERAKYLILDAIGVAYAASTYEFSAKTFDALHAAFGDGDRDVIGFSKRLTMRDAVLMNGALIHGVDFDDTYTPGYLHASASCLPTALAMAASLRSSGSDFLLAYILGMETAARVAAVAGNRFIQKGFHPTGLCAAFGCAVVAGRLYELTQEQFTMAQGIVLSMASGTREYSTDGAWSKRVHPGWAGVAGITSAALAKGGFVGPRAPYEGPSGLFLTHLGAESGYNLEAATAALGSRWEIAHVAIKPFAVCQLCIAPLDATIALATEDELDPDNVESIEVLVQPHAVKIVCEPVASKRRPNNSYAAQFSVQFAVACALIHKKFGLAELEQYGDARILALAEKVDYRVDPTPTPQHHNSAEVIIKLKNGQKVSHREAINRGGADRPISGDAIVAKFMQNAALAVSREKAQRVVESVLGVDRAQDVRSLSRELSTGIIGR